MFALDGGWSSGRCGLWLSWWYLLEFGTCDIEMSCPGKGGGNHRRCGQEKEEGAGNTVL